MTKAIELWLIIPTFIIQSRRMTTRQTSRNRAIKYNFLNGIPSYLPSTRGKNQIHRSTTWSASLFPETHSASGHVEPAQTWETSRPRLFRKQDYSARTHREGTQEPRRCASQCTKEYSTGREQRNLNPKEAAIGKFESNWWRGGGEGRSCHRAAKTRTIRDGKPALYLKWFSFWICN